jgi:hypothetical protein
MAVSSCAYGAADGSTGGGGGTLVVPVEVFVISPPPGAFEEVLALLPAAPAPGTKGLAGLPMGLPRPRCASPALFPEHAISAQLNPSAAQHLRLNFTRTPMGQRPGSTRVPHVPGVPRLPQNGSVKSVFSSHSWHFGF